LFFHDFDAHREPASRVNPTYDRLRTPPAGRRARAHHGALVGKPDRLGGAEERHALARAPFESAAAHHAGDRVPARRHERQAGAEHDRVHGDVARPLDAEGAD
jgi:hypothetical protein